MARVRRREAPSVRGVFPRTGSQQFIDGQRVDEAVARPLLGFGSDWNSTEVQTLSFALRSPRVMR
jgi:hypothetical protein